MVWFGEGLEVENLNKIDTALKKCDLFLLVSMLGGRERERGRERGREKGREGGEREREREKRYDLAL